MQCPLYVKTVEYDWEGKWYAVVCRRDQDDCTKVDVTEVVEREIERRTQECLERECQKAWEECDKYIPPERRAELYESKEAEAEPDPELCYEECREAKRDLCKEEAIEQLAESDAIEHVVDVALEDAANELCR